MNSRRSFFSRIAGLVATIAIAPELAFRAKLAFPEVKTFWVQDQCFSRCYDEEFLRQTGLTYVSNQNFQIPLENYEHASA